MNKFILIFVSLCTLLHSNILTGLDVLQRDHFKLLHNKNVGLVVNHTSVNKDGVHILDLLLSHELIKIQSIFTPEHGLKGNFSAGEKIPNTFNKDLNINIVSLYGKTHEPELSDLDGLDCIVFDIQDIGSRYYTYVSTLTYILNAASKVDLPVIILDRPNPLGRKVFGPIISSDFYSFVGMHPIPIRHGMTIGELGIMINEEGWLKSGKKVNLTIYKIENWDKSLGYFSIPPSPNIPSLETAIIYNGMCLFEGTNVSEGRGTKSPFTLFGAPWVDSQELLKELLDKDLEGVRFYQKAFKPISIEGVSKHPKYKDELCHGVKIDINEKEKVNPLMISILALQIISKNHPDHFSFNQNNFIQNLYGSRKIKDYIVNQYSMSRIMEDWAEDCRQFRSLRAEHLIY